MKILKFNHREQRIIDIFLQKDELNSSSVFNEFKRYGESVSLVTIKRTLSKLAQNDVLKISGAGRATVYKLSTIGRIFANVKSNDYIAIEPDKRYGFHKYNFDLFSSFPSEIFFKEELNILNEATIEYKKKISDISPVVQKKELERLIVELSWKSSKIEGNTYTLLDTENLLLRNKLAEGKTKEEAQMILNHKKAFDFIYKNKKLFKTLTKNNLEQIHSLIVENLNVNLGFRKNMVGISGSIYRPLDNIYQISEAVEALAKMIDRLSSPYAKSFAALLGIGYIQPFEDGNKRTSRLMTNALLMSYECAPLSYRSVDENEYLEATLVFYELNSIIPLKKIFIEQYNFAARNYILK